MDDARGLRGGEALVDRPRADFLLAGREVTLEAEEVVRRADHGVQRRFLHAHRLEHLLAVGLGKLGELGLDLRADDDDIAAGRLRVLAHPRDKRAFRADLRFVDVRNVERRLCRDHAEALEDLRLVAFKRDRTDRVARVQAFEALLEDAEAQHGLLVA